MTNHTLSNATVPVVGFVAPSGTGKTQLLKTLIASLKTKGLRVAVIKHSHHDFEIDKPGKDSYELRKSGATQMLIASKHRRALITESTPAANEVALNTLLEQLDQKAADIVLVEGFKFEQFPKIEVYRSNAFPVDSNDAPSFSTDPDIIAVASDIPLPLENGIVALDMNNSEQVAQFLIQYFSLNVMP